MSLVEIILKRGVGADISKDENRRLVASGVHEFLESNPVLPQKGLLHVLHGLYNQGLIPNHPEDFGKHDTNHYIGKDDYINIISLGDGIELAFPSSDLERVLGYEIPKGMKRINPNAILFYSDQAQLIAYLQEHITTRVVEHLTFTPGLEWGNG